MQIKCGCIHTLKNLLLKILKIFRIVVARDKKVDLAILKVYGLSNKIKPLTFGDIKNIELGDDVFSMGHPDSLHWSITDGIISSLEDYKIHSVKLI